jgi:hypothetical protein
LDAVNLAKRDALTTAQLAHYDIVSETITDFESKRKLREIDECSRSLAAPQFIENQPTMPTWLALNEIYRQLARVETTMGFVSTLVHRQEHSVVRLEEGTALMEAHMTSARLALRKHTPIATRRLYVKLSLVICSFLFIGGLLLV